MDVKGLVEGGAARARVARVDGQDTPLKYVVAD